MIDDEKRTILHQSPESVIEQEDETVIDSPPDDDTVRNKKIMAATMTVSQELQSPFLAQLEDKS